MRVGILGRTVAWDAQGREVPLRPQLRALLAMLALNPGTPVPVDRLVEAVHGDSRPANAHNALQAQVSRLRQALGADTVEHDAGGYRLRMTTESVDAHRFEMLAERGRVILESGDSTRASEVLTRAVRLWRGPPLADLEEARVVQDRAARLEELHLTALEDLSEADLGRGETAQVVPRLREHVANHPFRERGWILLVRALADDGRRAEALATFAEARELLADELGADPSPELTAEHLALLRDDDPGPGDGPVMRGLPAQLTALVGREEELERMRTLMDRTRLVTLTGPGGAGKTRLAIEAARGADVGACLVELAAVVDPLDVPRAVGSALGLRLQGGGPGDGRDGVITQLVNSLAGRRLLLVLDNCEHLTAAVAALSGELLARCPSLRVVATSRQPLGVTGETLVPVSGLLVGPEPRDDVDGALEHPAVRLLEDRVALVSPGFTVDEDTVDDVVRICWVLDGLPLAIELAAARARSRPLAEVASGLDAPFDLLSQGDHSGDSRHRSLSSVIEWSWDLLGDTERELLSRFSVFTGGAAPAAVRAVCGLPDTEELLAGLVDQSLLTLHEGRYGMLSTIRTFAAERLGDPERWRHRHAEYHLDLARWADSHLRGRDQLEWLRLLDAEYPNLRAALLWATAQEPGRALELAHGLATYWWLRGRRHDGAVLCRAALEAIGPTPPDGLVEEYILAALTAATETTDPDPIQEHLDTVVRVVDDIDGPPRQPMLTIAWARQVGPTPSRQGTLPSPPARLLGPDPWSRSLHALSDGLQQIHAGNAEEAEDSLLRALAGFRSLGERWGTLKALAEASRFPAWRGDHQQAITMLDEAVALATRLAATEEVAERYWQRAWCRAADGAPQEARADAAHAVEIAEATGIAEVTARALAASAEVSRATGHLAAARDAVGRAIEIVRPGWARTTDGGFETRLAAGRLAIADGLPDEALSQLLDLLDSGDALVEAGAVEGLAAVAVLRDDGARAAHLEGLAAALRGAHLVGDPDVDRVLTDARGLVGDEVVEAVRRMGRSAARGQALTAARHGWSVPGQ